MRGWLALGILSGLAAHGAGGAPGRLEAQLVEMGGRLEALQADSVRSIPAGILGEARGLLILRETTAGLILGGRSGSGVALVRTNGQWSAPAFYRSRDASLGLQAGWQTATFFQVLMTEAALGALQSNRFRYGVGLRVTSGPRTLGDEAKARSIGSDVLVYADTGGFFGGFAFEGGTLSPDERANRKCYGMEAADVLFGRRPPATPGGGAGLVELLNRSTAGTGGR